MQTSDFRLQSSGKSNASGVAHIVAIVVIVAMLAIHAADRSASAARTVLQGVHTFEVGPTDVSSTGLVVIGDYLTRGGFGIEPIVYFQVSVTGGDLDNFCLETRPHPDAEWAPYICGDAWDTATGNMPWATTADGGSRYAPHEVAEDGWGQAQVKVPCDSIRFTAVGTNAVATVRGTFSNR